MADDRLQIPQDLNYFQALGLAMIAFARLEWNAVWCCERLKAGYINLLEEKWELGRRIQRGKTAGMIAGDLKEFFDGIADPVLRNKVVPFAIEFEAIVKERNGLLHGRPGTAPNGDQRLFRHGSEWSIAAINLFSDRCVVAGIPLNALLYAELSTR